MMTTTLPYVLDRTLVIRATPETVFRFFTDAARWAAWWGAGSTVDARPGGRVYIRHPNGIEVSGEVLEVVSPERFVFTYGFESGKPIPPGASRVTIRLAPHGDGTRLTLEHEFAETGVRDEHVQGWRYQLAVFANVVANEVYAGAARAVDAWFAAWSVADAGERERAFAAIAAPTLRFRNRFSATEGLDDLLPHVAAALRFMPGITLTRAGEIRQCQGMVLANWSAAAADGQPRDAGTNVFEFSPDGRIAAVTGFSG